MTITVVLSLKHVMEAMKMEHRIAATESGTVAVIHHAVGEQVDAGSTLIDIESDE